MLKLGFICLIFKERLSLRQGTLGEKFFFQGGYIYLFLFFKVQIQFRYLMRNGQYLFVFFLERLWFFGFRCLFQFFSLGFQIWIFKDRCQWDLGVCLFLCLVSVSQYQFLFLVFLLVFKGVLNVIYFYFVWVGKEETQMVMEVFMCL